MNPSNHVAGKWKNFPVENIHKLSGCRKEHADHFPVENGSNFPVESENFPDTPMGTLVMHPTTLKMHEMGRANLKRAGSLKHLTHFATEI